jgi:hypothetical protein
VTWIKRCYPAHSSSPFQAVLWPSRLPPAIDEALGIKDCPPDFAPWSLIE